MKYFLRYPIANQPNNMPWKEVTKEKFVDAERECGFIVLWMNQPNEPATGGFGGIGTGGKVIQGYVEY